MRLIKRAASGLAILAVLAVPFILYFNAQALDDWWQLRNYSPPPAVASLASQDTMNVYARHIFYVNHPAIEANVVTFRNDCQVAEQAIVLGCYHSDQKGIFIYQVSDSRLNGVEQVTAAHEMLHGAYDRLSSQDKNYVDGLLQSFYNSGLHDQRVIDEINEYKQTEPNDVVNEMHSVFGTEVASLPQPLEAYYQRYFTNRQAVTNFAAAYQDEFTNRENEIKADDARLGQIKQTIDQEEQSLQAQLDQINADRSHLDSERSSGQISQYNSGVAAFNREIEQYNSGVDRLRSNITAYNNLVDQRNSIASDLASLTKALDTRLVPQTTQ